MNKYISYIALIGVILLGAIVLVGNQSGNGVGGTRFSSGLSADSTEPSAGEVRGTTFTSTGAMTIGGALAVSADLNYEESTEAVIAANTLALAESGKTSYLGGGTATTTLPAVASSDGAIYRFVVGAAVTGNIQIASAEGSNIEGSLMVAGAIVDCDNEGRIIVVADGENLGDYVELRSNGTNWYISSSLASTSAKMTCDNAL